ncbi:Ribosome assembly protein 1 [Diplonema papillatum]|nr:Ribosome assembly protein 1 [Diplonema papillatum]
MNDVEASRRILEISKDPTKVRNFCMLAHVDHGKTTLSDVLISSNGVISTALAGKVRYLDCREDEQQKLITMKASTIALRHTLDRVAYCLNLIDSPGHVDFSCEVSTAVRLSDGAFLLVDAVDGVATQTRAVLHQAYKEKVKCCLVINKIDLLFTSVQRDPDVIYHMLAEIIQNANVLMAEFVAADRITGAQLEAENARTDELDEEIEEGWFEPSKGNVVFASSVDGWGFTTKDFAVAYARKMGWKENTLVKALWGEWYLDQKKKKITRKPPRAHASPLCVKLVLEQIWRVYETMREKNSEERVLKLLKMTDALGLKVKENVLRKLTPENAVAAVMNAWLPLSRKMMDTAVTMLPSPVEAQQYRMSRLIPDLPLITNPDVRRLTKEGLTSCDPDGTPMVYIAKMLDIDVLPGTALQGNVEVEAEEGAPGTSFVGMARIFSGRLRVGDAAYVLDPKHKPGQPDTVKKVTVGSLYLLMGRGLEPVPEVSAGAVFGIGGLGQAVLKSATLSGSPDVCGFTHMVFQSTAVIRQTVLPKDAADMERLEHGLSLLNKADPQVQVAVSENGEFVISTAGEVHAERCIRDLQDRYAKVEMMVSEPLVSFRETVVAVQKTPATVLTANKQCTFTIKAFEVPQEVVQCIDGNLDALRALTEYDNAFASAPEELIAAGKDLRAAFAEADTKGRWLEYFEAGLWALGPKHCGTCMLVCTAADVAVASVWTRFAEFLAGGAAAPEAAEKLARQAAPEAPCAPPAAAPPAAASAPDETAGAVEEDARSDASSTGETKKRLLRQLNDSIVAGFQLACDKGPMCDEPMSGVCFVVEDVKTTAASAGLLSGQVMSTICTGCRQAFMNEGKRLVEPIYECSIMAANSCHGKVYEVLKKRRCEILDNLPIEGSEAFTVIASLPVAESFGLTDELRIKTSGMATPNVVFSHWHTIDMDPYFVRQTEDELEDLDENDVALIANVPLTLINKVRRRKGLPVAEQVVQKAEKMKYSTRAG